MKAIIVEDEQSAADNLRFLLQSVAPEIQVLEVIETVSEAIDYFKENQSYNLVFMDIHLADGNSFEIVQEVEPAAPIIFTTAFDQYAIQAFKLNSIDYLLKPVREGELKNAVQKFKAQRQQTGISPPQMEALLGLMASPRKKYRNSFLVQKKETFIPIPAPNFAFFFIQNGVVRGTTQTDETYHFDEKLEDLENDLDPDHFFRANRQYLVQRSAIESLHTYFHGRLVVKLRPSTKDKVIVSKTNARKLKAWLNGSGG